MQKWRLLLPESCAPPETYGRAGEAAWNMAFDESLLDSLCAGESLPALRLYFWQQSAITIGRFQNVVRTLDLDAIQSQQIPIARRITGGRGILHGHDLTISIAAPVEALGLAEGTSIASLYEKITAGYVRGFVLLGVPASQGSAASPPERGQFGDCFHQTSEADIADPESGHKRLGAAIHRRGPFILQQASTPVRPVPRLVSPFRGGIIGGLNLSESLNPGSITQAMITGIAAELGIEFVPGSPSAQEKENAERLLLARYALPIWTQRGVCLPMEDEIDS